MGGIEEEQSGQFPITPKSAEQEINLFPKQAIQQNAAFLVNLLEERRASPVSFTPERQAASLRSIAAIIETAGQHPDLVIGNLSSSQLINNALGLAMELLGDFGGTQLPEQQQIEQLKILVKNFVECNWLLVAKFYERNNLLN